MSLAVPSEEYGATLRSYLETRSEEALYHASLLSQELVESGLGPEDIIALHVESLEKTLGELSYVERARAIGDAHQFLLDMMIAYGIKYKEFLELRLRESIRQAEARVEAERQRALDAERLGRQRSELLGVIAHELRTPLAAAMGNLDLAKRSLARGQTERLPRLLETARGALDRLSRLTGDLVEGSRGEPLRLERTVQELHPIVVQACAWAEPTALSRSIILVQEPCAERLTVLASADALLSVFGNLLSNAIRYTPPGGRVTVRQRPAGDEAVVEIVDTGIGMSPETLKRIFEKFYRAPEARQVEARGLGLGLSLVAQFVQAHRGRVEVESEPDRGSTFRVVLPLHRDAEEAPNDDR